MSNRHAAYFISHAGPDLVLDPREAGQFMGALGASIPRPDAILFVSAHWVTDRPTISTAELPETIYDFGGFAPELYEMKYPAPGAPYLAERLAGLNIPAGLATDPTRGLDHGAWNVLMLMFPDADIPVAQLSVQPGLGFDHHWKLGEALRPLRDDGVLIIASGTMTHNLRDLFGSLGQYDREPFDYAARFDRDIAALIKAGDWDGLREANRHPDYRRAHPSDEHFVPLLVAAGAGDGVSGRTIHNSFRGPAASMRSFAFD
ncbi:DODA-type extradiol aromatic ring-opening family dioxygenase [Aestuariispira ectoiniformans]|uniref:DODA-type extradiol aromatic ring-opening family dioxygenase n=1 Tax=Aestuariispira ectoiniformans TaxID=2775080 RepID=UPI00223BFF64|nr:class III extradiol ring-cleavage dioxygenase [Aestuariispira ectoiniformans]